MVRELRWDAAQRAVRPPAPSSRRVGVQHPHDCLSRPFCLFCPLHCPFFALQSRLISSIFASLLPDLGRIYIFLLFPGHANFC